MVIDIENQVAIVTGGSRELGRYAIMLAKAARM